MRAGRVVRWTAGTVGALVLAAALGVYLLTNTTWGRVQVRTRALAALQSAVHGQVHVGVLRGNLLRGVTLDSLAIADSTGAPFVTAEQVRVGYALWPLISKRIELSDVQLVGAHAVLDRPAHAAWNYDRIFPSDSTKPSTGPGFGSWVTLRDVTLVRSTLLVRTATDSTTSELRFDGLDGHMPLLRLADPDRPTRRIEVDSLRAVVWLARDAVPARIEQLRGTFELNTDSVWFGDVHTRLPASALALTGRYTFAPGDLDLVATGAPAALADLRFLMPELPPTGEARLTAHVQWVGTTQRYAVRALNLTTDSTRIRGAVAITRNTDSLATAAEAFRIDSLALTVRALSTALIEQLAPAAHAPVRGSLNGSAVMAGIPAALTVTSDMSFTDARGVRSHLLADGRVGFARGVLQTTGLSITVNPLDARLVRTFVPTIPLGGAYRGHAVINGRSDRTIEARNLMLEHRERGARSQLTGRAAATMSPRGVAALDVDLFASPLSLETVGRFAPAAGLRGSVRGPVQVHGPMSALAVEAALRTPDSGSIAARGTVDLANRELGYALDVRTVLFNAQAVSSKAPRTSLSAVAQVRARGVDPATMRGTFRAQLLASRLDTVAVDSLAVQARTANGLLTLDTLALFGPATFAEARGTLGLSAATRGALTWQLRVDSLPALARYLPPADTGAVPPRPLRTAERRAQLAQDSVREARALAVARAAGAAPPARPIRVDSARSVPRDTLAGSLRAAGDLQGSLSDLTVRGTADVRDLLARGQAISRARATLDWRHLRTDSAFLHLTASVDSARLGGFALDSVTITAGHRPTGGSAQVAVFQNGTRDYSAKADYAIYADRKEVRFSDLRLRFDTTMWTTAHPGGVRWGQPGVFIDSLDLRSGRDGRVFANGRVPSEGAVDLTLLVNRFELGDLLGLAQSDLAGRGALSVNTRVVGTAKDPRITADLSLREAQYQGATVPNLDVSGRYAAERLDVNATLQDSSSARALATATAALPINLALSSVTESRLPDRPATGLVRADSLPLDLISRFTDALADLRGAATGRIALAGTLRSPTLDGTVRLRDAAARIAPLGINLTGVHGDLRLQKDTVVLDSLVAWSGGRVAITGGVGIRTISAPAVDLRLVADHARVLDNDQGRVRADAEITARGPFDNVVVRGRAHVREGVLYIPRPDDREVISAGDPTVFAVVDTTDVRTRELLPAQSPLLANLQMDLGLRVDRDTWVRSPEANIEIFSDGELRVLVDRRRQALAIDGTVNTDRGEYEFLGKRFQVKRGAVQFIGTQEINPLLQITGEYTVQQPARPALAIRIVIGGTLQSPRLTLESDAQPPISQSDLLSYLAFGSEAGSLLQFGGSSLSGGTPGGGLVGTSAALATRQLTGIALGVAVDELEGQAARSLGADVFTITPANLPTELASGNFGALTTFLKGTGFTFGKYLSTRTFLGLQLQATTTPGLHVQHQLSRTPGLSLDATFQPRFFLPEPSLAPQEITKANALGLFLARRWRF